MESKTGVGTPEGARDEMVGTFDGTFVAMMEGAVDGTSVGLFTNISSVGVMLGCSVGSLANDFDGNRDGSIDGDRDGLSVIG